MAPTVPTILLVVVLLLAGCGAHFQSESREPTATHTATRTTPMVSCDTFGTGGVFHVADANESIRSPGDALDALQTARSNGALDAANSTEFSFVPPADVDERTAVRTEIQTLPSNATLYYFSPDGDTDVHGMAIVSETGRIYRAYVGACWG